MKKYSFLIPTSNNIHFTERCLQSLLTDLEIEGVDLDLIEILFLDEHSIDGLKELRDWYKELAIEIIQFEKGKGSFSKKNNVGAKRATGEFLILLNNDIEVLDNFLLPMCRALEDESIGIVSNKHYFPDMKLNHVGIAFRKDKTPVHLYPHEEDVYKFLKINRVVPAVTAACAVVRREEFLEIGGFDEEYIYGYEDVDLCLKYREQLGKSSYIVADSRMIHFGQSTYGRETHENKNREYFLSKWGNSSLLTSFEEIYKADSYEKVKKWRNIINKNSSYPSKVFQKVLKLSEKENHKEVPLNNPELLTEKDVVVFFDDNFNSFNVVLKNLYNALRDLDQSEFQFYQEYTANFEKYASSRCYTITWTHFWENYYKDSRTHSERDLRFYAINYERKDPDGYLDFWTKHIIKSSFRVLPISKACEDFLVVAGCDKKRLSTLNIGYWNEFDKFKPLGKKTGKKTRYLAITNSNDPGRYNTETAVIAFAKAFKNIKKEVQLVLKDYGNDRSYVPHLKKMYLEGLNVEVIQDYLSNDELAKVYLSCDLLLSPHRGEGFGMKVLEAAVSGLPIICPDGGGPRDFLDMSTHIPVKYSLVPVGDTIDKRALFLEENYVDFEVDLTDLSEKLSETHAQMSRLKKEASEKSINLRKKFNWRKIASDLLKELNPQREDFLPSNRFIEELEKYKPIAQINEVENPTFSILINSVNRPEKLANQLEWLSRVPDLKKVECEIVIVDDGSDIGGLSYEDVVKRFEDTSLSITLYGYKKNRGMTYSKNLLLNKSRGKYSIFMGDDILPLSGFLERRLKVHESSDKTLVLGHTEWAPEIRNNLIAEFSVKSSGFQFAYEEFRNSTVVDPINLYTSNISFNTDAVRSQNLYFENIENIKLYEDSLWGKNLSSKGFTMVYDRKIEALHDHDVNLDWLIQRSRVIGRTKVMLMEQVPSFNDVTHADTYLQELQKNSRLMRGNSGKSSAKLIELWEKCQNEVYWELQSLILNEDNYLRKKEFKKILNKHLHAIVDYNICKGFLEEIGVAGRAHLQLAQRIMNLNEVVRISVPGEDRFLLSLNKFVKKVGKKVLVKLLKYRA